MNRAGIFFEKDKALVAQTTSKGKILNLKTIPKRDVKQLDTICKLFFTAGVLPPSQVLVKTTEMKTLSKWLFKKNLHLQKDIITALPKDEAISIVQISKQSSKKTTLSFQITKKKYLSQFLNELDPHILISTPQALTRFARHYFPQNLDLAIIHLGESETTCLHLKSGFLTSSYTINSGLGEISTQEGQSVEKLSEAKKQLLENLSNQINNILTIFAKDDKIALLLTGKELLLKHLDLFILSKNKDLISSLLQPENPDWQRYAIAIGASLEAANTSPMQFRDGSFFSKRLIRKTYKMLSACFLFFLTLSGLIFWQGETIVKDKITDVTENFSKLFSSTPSSFQDLEKRLILLEKKEEKNPFLVTAPKVNEVLLWISSHPLFSQKKEVEITDFKYELVSLPKIGKLKIPYLAKVELVFKTDNSILARQIHAALQKGDGLIALKPELLWESSDPIYKAIFYLRNQVRHEN